MTGNIFNIQRFSTQDGPGIRSVVFFKGCPLSCTWCHNPESKRSETEIFYNHEKCIHCRMCEKVCPNGQHIFKNGTHEFLRNDCRKCMKCVQVCPANALEVCGQEYTVDQVIEEVLRDVEFYEQSGGGVTLSGGEPLMQFDFSLELLKKLKERGVHTAVETCGYCHRDLREIEPYVDLWLYDVKLFPEREHIKHTGASNEIILKNLKLLDNLNGNIVLRCPIIPDVNLTEMHFEEIVNLANSLNHVVAVHFEPYHPLGIHKAEQLGKAQSYQNKEFLSRERLLLHIDSIRDKMKIEVEVL